MNYFDIVFSSIMLIELILFLIGIALMRSSLKMKKGYLDFKLISGISLVTISAISTTGIIMISIHSDNFDWKMDNWISLILFSVFLIVLGASPLALFGLSGIVKSLTDELEVKRFIEFWIPVVIYYFAILLSIALISMAMDLWIDYLFPR
jgi:hypothetical protein